MDRSRRRARQWLLQYKNGIGSSSGNWLEMLHCHPARRWLWLFDNKSTALMRGPLFLPALKDRASRGEMVMVRAIDRIEHLCEGADVKDQLKLALPTSDK